MSQRADFAGELALDILSRGGVGRVTRVFPSAVYVRRRADFLLLLWGGLKSPMTINLPGQGKSKGTYTVGESLGLSSGGFESRKGRVSVAGAEVYRGSLRKKRDNALPTSGELAKGVAMLRSLYDVSILGPHLTGDEEFGKFVEIVLTPYAEGKEAGIHDFRSYAGLIGRGGGFTPAGDDFVAGFTATFNFIARNRRTKLLTLPRRLILSKTVPESGAMVVYSSRGYVDEAMERLILSSLARTQAGFHDELLSFASRGHTSGVDMALGVLMCEAATAERERKDGTLERCMRAL